MNSKTANAGSAKLPQKPTIAAIRAYIAEQTPSTVYVKAEHAHHFRRPPRDGNLYVVEDPKQRGVLHWTSREGVYTRLTLTDPPRVRIEPKKVKGATTQVRSISQLPPSVAPESAQESDPLPVRLINLERVMLMTGFSKSFLYERKDFPKPLKLGKSKRDASRWLEAEVLAWINKLAASRDNGQTEG